MQIFGGSSNPNLVKQIAKLIGVEEGVVESSTFENGERRVRVGDGKKAQNLDHKAVMVQSLSTPVDSHLMEFCLLADALSRQGYTNLIGVIPWLGYSKQDKVFLPGEPLSAKVVAQIIQTTKIKKLLTFDLHNRAITGFFEIPAVELSAKPIFLEYFKAKIGLQDDNSDSKEWVVVAPDAGAVKASAYFARELEIPIAYMDKRRDLKTGIVSIVGMTGGVEGKNVIIVDDMIVTGSTTMETAKYLKERGAKSVSVAATHHLYVPGVQERLEKSEIDEVVVSDTVSEKSQALEWSKLKILSVAQMIVDAID